VILLRPPATNRWSGMTWCAGHLLHCKLPLPCSYRPPNEAARDCPLLILIPLSFSEIYVFSASPFRRVFPDRFNIPLFFFSKMPFFFGSLFSYVWRVPVWRQDIFPRGGPKFFPQKLLRSLL